MSEKEKTEEEKSKQESELEGIEVVELQDLFGFKNKYVKFNDVVDILRKRK